MKKALRAAAAALALLSTPAFADTQDLFTSGAWTAFGGTSTDGQAVCGMEEHGRSSVFALKWFDGDSRLTVHFLTAHYFPAGSNVPVEMRFDANTPWQVQAVARALPSGGGTVLQFYINPATGDDALGQFLTEMQTSRLVRFSFPGSDMGDVIGDLTGSTATLNAFGDCISFVKHHVPPATGASTPPSSSGRGAGTYF